jgi:hypothetical protein
MRRLRMKRSPLDQSGTHVPFGSWLLPMPSVDTSNQPYVDGENPAIEADARASELLGHDVFGDACGSKDLDLMPGHGDHSSPFPRRRAPAADLERSVGSEPWMTRQNFRNAHRPRGIARYGSPHERGATRLYGPRRRAAPPRNPRSTRKGLAQRAQDAVSREPSPALRVGEWF